MNRGKSIKIALNQTGKNQKWLAEQLSTPLKTISKQQVSNWCHTGKMHDDTMEKISALFGLSVSQFIHLGED